MSKFLNERCRLIESWKKEEEDHRKKKQQVMKRLGELLNLHNRETENDEHSTLEDENQQREGNGLLQRVREKQDGCKEVLPWRSDRRP